MEDDKFLLDEDENYEKVCGEVLLTSNKRVAIHCTLCDERYVNFDAYINHLFEEHENTTEISYDDPHPESFFDEQEAELHFLENTPQDADNCDTNVKIEISCYDTQELKEEEIPISTIIIPDDELKSKDSQRDKTQERMDRDKKLENDVIRSVKRRTLWKSRATNDVEKKHKCPICSLGFKEKHNMHHHLKRHYSSKKEHACPDCSRTFYTPSEVRTHMRLHSGERDYLCSDCGRSFKKNADLKNHIKRHENQRDFKCTMCDKAFFNSKTLKNHMVVHSNEKPYSCHVCFSSFSRTLSLSNHMKLHENKRAYKCSICGSGFNQQAGLFSHMKATHNKRK